MLERLPAGMFQHRARQNEIEQRFRLLTTAFIDLAMEVEALREAQIAGSTYRQAYRDSALLTHDSTGPSSGIEKLLSRFYPKSSGPDGRNWREVLVLERLGFTPKEILKYQEEAELHETRT